jgi:hypothetical protein
MQRSVGTVDRSETQSGGGFDDDLERDLLREQLVRGGVTAFEAPLLAVYRGASRPAAGPMMAATGAWFALVFALCYVALPAFGELTGLHRGLLGTTPVAALSFGATAFVTAVTAGIVRPSISGATRDPVLAATLGGLLVWGVVHNTSWLLRPFSAMSFVELGTFLTFNVIEMFLVGSMLASLTKSRVLAFGLGGTFQLVSLGLFLTLWRILA